MTVTDFEPVTGGVLKEDSVIRWRLVIVWALDVLCSDFAKQTGDIVNLRHAGGPESNPVFVWNVCARFGHAKEFGRAVPFGVGTEASRIS